MPPPINPLNPPQVDERNLRKLLTEGLGSGGEDVEIGNVLRRGGKRGPMGADATFRGKIRPDQPGLRYNLLLIADADRGGQPRFVNLDALRWVKALNRMARPWGDPQASHNTIPREERRYAKDATYTTSGGNTGVRHYFPPGYGPLDDEDAPPSRQPKEPISELRGPAGRERFVRWLTEGGVGTRTRDFSEGTAMDGLGAQFAAPGRGLLNDGGRWSRGRFMPKGAAERLAQSLGVMRIPTAGQFALGGQDFSILRPNAGSSPSYHGQDFARQKPGFGIEPWQMTADEFNNFAPPTSGDSSESIRSSQERRKEGGSLADYDDETLHHWLGKGIWDNIVPRSHRDQLVAAIRGGRKIPIWRATQTERSIFPGAYVTPSKEYAQLHGEGPLNNVFRMLRSKVSASDLFPINELELKYAPEIGDYHINSIREAMKNGRGVPLRVLESYPNIKFGRGQGFSLTGGAADRSPGAVNHFMPGRRQQFALGEQQFGIRSIPPTADAYISRLRSWTGRMPGGEHTNRELYPLSDVEPPDMPAREEVEGDELSAPNMPAWSKKTVRRRYVKDVMAGKIGGVPPSHPLYSRLNARLGRVSHGGLDYDPSEMSDRVPTDAEKREIVGEGIWDTRRAMGGPENLYGTGGKLQDYEVERLLKGNANLSRHALEYPNYPAQQEASVNVPGSATDLRTRLLEMELNDPSGLREEQVRYRKDDLNRSLLPGEEPYSTEKSASIEAQRGADELSSAVNSHENSSDIRQSVVDRFGGKHRGPHAAWESLKDAIMRETRSRHRFAIGSQDFALRPQPQLGALGNAQLVPIMLPQGQAPAVGVTPTGGYAPPPQNAALIPARRFALGEQEMGGSPGLGMQQQFRLNDDHESDGVQDVKAEPWTTVDSARRSVMQNLADRRQTPRYQKVPAQNVPLDQYTHQLSKRGDVSTWRNGGASIPRDRYGNVARQQAGGERSWGDWWQGLNNGLEDWIKGPGMSAVKSGGRALLQGGVDAIGGLGYRQLGGGVRDVGRGLGNALGGNVARGLGGIARGVGRVGLGLGQGVLSGLGGIAKSLYGDYTNRSRQGVNPQRVGAASYSPSDKAFMRSTRQKYSLGEQDFSREDDFGDLLSQLGLGSDIPPVADEPLVVPPQTPEEMMRARATINTAHGPRDLYDMDPEKISGYLRGQGLLTAGKQTQKRLRAVYGASGRIEPERAQQIVQGPHETGVAGRVADIVGDLPHQQAPSESPEQRRRRVSGRELGSFGLGEQDFGLLDTIKHIGSMVNPVTNYRNLREGGHGRLASGAMVGGGLLGDAMLTGFHPPLVSLGVGRYAQGKAQAADRASDERRAEWMRG